MNRIALMGAVWTLASAWSLESAATATLQGRVFAQDTGLPLAGVSVSQDSGCDEHGCSYGSTDSDADGRFTLAVQAGGVQLFLIPDYSTDYRQQSDSFNVVDGDTVAVVYYLELGGSVSGTVRRADTSAPVPDVFVSFSSSQDGFGVQTDANGYYEAHQVNPETYVATVQVPSGINLQQQWYSGREMVAPSQGLQLADPIAVTSGHRSAPIDFNLVVGVTLNATVTDRFTGALLRNTSLYTQFYDSQPTIFGAPWYTYNTVTDANGVLSLTGLPVHNVLLQVQGGLTLFTPYVYDCGENCAVSSGTVVPLSMGASTDIAFSLQPGGVVAGRVVSKQSGVPIPGAQVTLFQSTDGGSPVVLGTAITDAHGNYAVENLTGYSGTDAFAKVSDARLDDTVFINQIYGGFDCAISTCLPTGAEPYVPIVENGVSPNINFQLDEGGEIAGSSTAYANYNGALDVYMELFHDDGTLDSAFFTDHSGNFASGGLAPGTYYLVSYPAIESGLSCMIYELIPCTSGASPQDVGTPIVVSGAQHVLLTVPLYTQLIFSNGFE